MTKVCKSDCEGTVVGTRGNGEVAPIPAVRGAAIVDSKPTLSEDNVRVPAQR
jgi:hypothetical protein